MLKLPLMPDVTREFPVAPLEFERQAADILGDEISPSDGYEQVFAALAQSAADAPATVAALDSELRPLVDATAAADAADPASALQAWAEVAPALDAALPGAMADLALEPGTGDTPPPQPPAAPGPQVPPPPPPRDVTKDGCWYKGSFYPPEECNPETGEPWWTGTPDSRTM